MRFVRRLRNRGLWWFLSLVATLAAGADSAAGTGDLSHFLGTWHGTSTCVNRKAAPDCKDETVVYVVRRSGKPQAAVLEADKIVDGKRVPMGELEFTYSEKEGCWRAEFTTPRVRGVWRLFVDGKKMTGGLRALPDEVEVRRVKLERESRASLNGPPIEDHSSSFDCEVRSSRASKCYRSTRNCQLGANRARPR